MMGPMLYTKPQGHRASIKGSLGVIYSQNSPLNCQIWMAGGEVLVIMKYIVT